MSAVVCPRAVGLLLDAYLVGFAAIDYDRQSRVFSDRRGGVLVLERGVCGISCVILIVVGYEWNATGENTRK